MSKSAFSQYLKHSQLPHKYHLYSRTVIQHIKEYHLQSSTVTQYDYLSPCMWTWNKDTEQDKIPSKQKHRDHVISLPSLTQDSRPLCALLVKSSTEGHLGFHKQLNLATGQFNCGWAAGLCTDIAIYFYLLALCWKRPFLLIQKKKKERKKERTRSTMSFSISLPTEITAEPFQATASLKKQLLRLILVSVFSEILQHLSVTPTLIGNLI